MPRCVAAAPGEWLYTSSSSGHRYLLSTQLSTFDEAQARCGQLAGYMVAYDNAAEQVRAACAGLCCCWTIGNDGAA